MSFMLLRVVLVFVAMRVWALAICSWAVFLGAPWGVRSRAIVGSLVRVRLFCGDWSRAMVMKGAVRVWLLRVAWPFSAPIKMVFCWFCWRWVSLVVRLPFRVIRWATMSVPVSGVALWVPSLRRLVAPARPSIVVLPVIVIVSLAFRSLIMAWPSFTSMVRLPLVMVSFSLLPMMRFWAVMVTSPGVVL